MFTFSFYPKCNANHRVRGLLQLFSSEASAQSMTWLHQAEAGTQLPSLHDDSDEPHVTSGGRELAFQKDDITDTETVTGTSRNITGNLFLGVVKINSGLQTARHRVGCSTCVVALTVL